MDPSGKGGGLLSGTEHSPVLGLHLGALALRPPGRPPSVSQLAWPCSPRMWSQMRSVPAVLSRDRQVQHSFSPTLPITKMQRSIWKRVLVCKMKGELVAVAFKYVQLAVFDLFSAKSPSFLDRTPWFQRRRFIGRWRHHPKNQTERTGLLVAQRGSHRGK